MVGGLEVVQCLGVEWVGDDQGLQIGGGVGGGGLACADGVA